MQETPRLLVRPKPLIAFSLRSGLQKMDHSPSSIENFEYGITREWLHNKCIAVIRTQGVMSRAAIDCWAEVNIKTIREWSGDGPIALLNDLSSKRQGVTPYGMKRSEDVFNTIPPNCMSFDATVFTNPIMVSLANLFLQRLPNNHHHVVTHIFSTYGKALSWLEEKIQVPHAEK
jgi:hypothetical protein